MIGPLIATLGRFRSRLLLSKTSEPMEPSLPVGPQWNTLYGALGLRIARSAAVLLLIAFIAPLGCDQTPPTDGNGTGGNDNGQQMVDVAIDSLKTNFEVSEQEEPITIFYSVSTNAEIATVSSFHVPVADASPDSAALGDRVIISTNLPAGSMQAFNFDPSTVGVGFYRLGIIVDIPGQQSVVSESSGVIQIQGRPRPTFLTPRNAVTGEILIESANEIGVFEVDPGTDVIISFDVGDPEGVVQWRLFYLSLGDSRLASPDRLGTQLQVGSGNVGNVTFSTAGFDPGDFELGISATDTGSSVSSAVASGDFDRIVTVPNDSGLAGEATKGPIIRVRDVRIAMPPTLAFQAPADAEVELFGDQDFIIEFAATVNEPGATGFVDIFYDDDQNPDDRTFPIESGLSLAETRVTLDTRLIDEEGTYFIGGFIDDGINDRVVVYATGRITLVRSSFLTVTAPTASVTISPSSAGSLDNSVPITWTTNVPISAGMVEVFAQRLDETGAVGSDKIQILDPTDLTVTSASFATDVSGVYELFVQITFNNTSLTALIRSSPGLVRVSGLPTVVWLEDIASANPTAAGAVFQGVNFEDNAGTSFAAVNDLNGDGRDEFVIAARYGKPFFVNPSGIGSGEAYLIYGTIARLNGTFNLNSVGTTTLTGVTFTGIRTPQISNTNPGSTFGLSSVSRLPDVDGDGNDEIAFGFPFVESRGHNVSPLQDGVVDPRALATLEREDQFLRGGLVFVSSQNSVLSAPTVGSPVINLDMVGQDFDVTCVQPEPDSDQFAVALDVKSAITSNDACIGTCNNPNGGGKPDATDINYGFVSALARDFFWTFVYQFEFFDGISECPIANGFLDHGCPDLGFFHDYCTPITSACEPFSPGLHADAADPDFLIDPFGIPTFTRHSGFYPALTQDAGGNLAFNNPREPLGARVIGIGFSDAFGASIALSDPGGTGIGDVIVSAPARSARGILLGPDAGPEAGGEIDGLESAPGVAKTNTNSGVAYIFPLRSLWTPDNFARIPPKPHQYIVGSASHCGGPSDLIPNLDATRIAGFASDFITNIVGIDDFNGDGRNDFAIGAPNANGGQGRVYIAFRRDPAIEGDYVLEKLALDPGTPERLTGVLIVTGGLDGMGASLISGVDFNGDGQRDLVIGSPNADGGVGEVIVVFGDPNLLSPVNGVSVQILLSTRNSQGLPRAVRISGNPMDANGRFGFNIANAGDVDDDGFNDLLVAAPNASPRFDPNPTDSIDELTMVGVDTNLDGLSDTSEDLTNAGLVYVISGANRLDQIIPDPLTGEITISVDQLGSGQLRGYMIAGRHAGDRIGGGDAGDNTAGGIVAKNGRGRSFGLASAGDVDGDGRDDILIGSILADPRTDPNSGIGIKNAGEAYLLYSTVNP